MARSDSGSSAAARPSGEVEGKIDAINTSKWMPRRQLTLITITTLLNLLLWSSITCLATSVYQVASDSKDTTNIAPVVLTTTSALVTITYTFVHTKFSYKQRIWNYHKRHAAAIKKTDYVAVRMVVMLCALWLITSGWNMIIVARRPICVQHQAPGLQGWEYGPRCFVGRVSIGFSMVALVASCILFGVLATVRRPFEAHLFKHGYERPADYFNQSTNSRGPSPTRRPSYVSEKRPLGRRHSVSSFRTTASNFSSTNIDHIDWNVRMPPQIIQAPPPIRSIGLGIFTSNSIPPPIPSAYVTPPRQSSLERSSPVLYPMPSLKPLTRPPRLSGHPENAGSMMVTMPAQYSASTLRALHPSMQSSMGLTSHLQLHLLGRGFVYHGQHSQSTISLTRPHQLSYMTPASSVDWSSRSGSEGRRSSVSTDSSVSRRKASYDLKTPIRNDTSLSSSTPQDVVHVRKSSASDTTSGVQIPQPWNRMAMGWKPQLSNLTHQTQPTTIHNDSATEIILEKSVKQVQSTSAGFLSHFSPDIHPDDSTKFPQPELKVAIDVHSLPLKPLRHHRAASVSALQYNRIPVVAADPAEAAKRMLSKMPKDIKVPRPVQGNRRSMVLGEVTGNTKRVMKVDNRKEKVMVYEEIKNKPLPRIAVF